MDSQHQIPRSNGKAGNFTSQASTAKKIVLVCGHKNTYLLLSNKVIWYYRCGLWGAATESHINRIQVTQNKVMGLIIATWYVRNSTLHSDLTISMVRACACAWMRISGHDAFIASISEVPLIQTENGRRPKRLNDSFFLTLTLDLLPFTP